MMSDKLEVRADDARLIWAVMTLWRTGTKTTAEIAKELCRQEAEVAQIIHDSRERQRATDAVR